MFEKTWKPSKGGIGNMLKKNRNMFIFEVKTNAGRYFFLNNFFFIAKLEPSHKTKFINGPEKAIIDA